MDLSLRMDYYGGEFIEDGSFLVLNANGMSLSPSTPPQDRPDEGDEKPLDIEVLNNEADDETPVATTSSDVKPQVLGEDSESSLDSRHSTSIKPTEGNGELNGSQQEQDAIFNSMANLSVASVSSASTEAHLAESNEELNILMAENKNLTDLLAHSNEKIKQCITTTEKLKTDHEEYKRKNETSREMITQLRQENEMLRSQVSMTQSQITGDASSIETELKCKTESLQRKSHTISELNERLNTVLTYNGKLNDQLLTSQRSNEELRAELEQIQTDKETAVKQIATMREEIEAGRKTVAKFNEHQLKIEEELGNSKSKVAALEAVVEEKTKLTESLRRNMQDTVTTLDRLNHKINQKEQEISLLMTKLAALNAETEGSDRLQALETQCRNYQAELTEVKEQRAKISAEKEALLLEINARNQQLKETSDEFENYRRQTADAMQRRDVTRRNDNSADNANQSLPSPLTSLPSVAGQLVGFVRREILGWEDQFGAVADTNLGGPEGTATSETVVQQPKQEAIPPCPICRKSFASLERLQTHASNCGIENDDGEPDDPFVFP